MTTEDQIKKLKSDLENMQKAAQKHQEAMQQHLGACGYIQGRIIELEVEGKKEQAAPVG